MNKNSRGETSEGTLSESRPHSLRRRSFLAACAAGGTAVSLVPSLYAAEDKPESGAEPSGPAAAARMQAGEPSVTARLAAIGRALHQIVDAPLVFQDPFALPMVIPITTVELGATLRAGPGMRASIVARSRVAEDRLALAAKRGVRQYVVLGAGLDTFACRNPFAAKGLRVFEVDHPATQARKRERLAQAGIAPRRGTVFVPVDFATQSLREQLKSAGFRFDRPAFFSLLGVVIYLPREATMETMQTVAGCARGSEIVFSFSTPVGALTDAQRERREKSSARMEQLGEPWITYYEPNDLERELSHRGFSATEVLSPDAVNQLHFRDRSDGLRMTTGHLMVARV